MHSETQTVDQRPPSFIEQARRAQIIDCAIAAIAELGFAQASLAQIAKRANVSTGVILYYFAGKEELIRAVVAHVYGRGAELITPAVNAEPTARGALLAFIRANVAFFRDHPDYGRAVMHISRSGVPGAFDPGVDQPRQTAFRAILAAGQQSGEFRAFSVDVMATSIVESMDIIPRRHADNPALDLDAYAAELVELFDRATRAHHPDQDVQSP
ncbi:MAG TPA: TetR/AcrR family transcriptional regulator [Caulobacteraceae bacterium]|nr:TetR/AcrR family transcriptional regulator [Caulobacteraceae bacterium]